MKSRQKLLIITKMKKNLLMFTLLLVSAFVSAETMRVAILEPVDRESKVSYGTKLILRSNLSKAVTNTAGYEAYDRSDMDAIMGEQNFQRTGLVSEDQIKRLGEMTGAKYILVAEAAVIDADNMFITAKLLDVESARTIMTDNLMMGNSASKIQEGCIALAKRLFRSDSSSDESASERSSKFSFLNKPKSQAQTISQSNNGERPVLVRNSKMVRKYGNRKEFSFGDIEMDEKELFTFLSYNCPEAFKKIVEAKKQKQAGWGIFGATCMGLLPVYVPCLVAGYINYKKAIDYFNKQCPVVDN